VGRLVGGEARVGHRDVAELLEEAHGDRIALREQAIGSRDLAHEPVAIAPLGHSPEIGADEAAGAERVTGGTAPLLVESLTRAGLARRADAEQAEAERRR
jgi:hypothetical protein